MSTDAASSFGLGPIDQVSFAVHDVEDAARRWEPLFGPFEIRTVDLPSIEYRGPPLVSAAHPRVRAVGGHRD